MTANETTGEPEVIAILREHRPLRFEFREEILAAYDAMKAERDAAVRERDAARDKNIHLHALVKKYKNKATKQGQKQKKNHKLAKYADESNASLRARLAACQRVVEGLLQDVMPVNATTYTIGKRHLDALRAAVAAETTIRATCASA